ncbi:adhesion G-protein coupled receptor G7 [Neoarius graeffei]|uniref:adhesion G-protein coupled receptor G7 n=1 Tax=Neoarius graeffei TaxID=443677 RepID=UPI00298BD072|nr:adhesion G-protein coupled receptor G7 [Neoarius graeffei]
MAAFESSPAVVVNIQERERIIQQTCASSCFELVGGCVLVLMQEVRVSCAGNLKNVLSENEARVQGEKHEKKQKGIRGKKKDTKDRLEGGEDVHLAAITTVSQLLTADMKQLNNVTADSITRLTQRLQTFSLNQSHKGSSLVQPNIAIQSFKVSQSSEIQNYCSSDTFSANRIKMNNIFVDLSNHHIPIDVQIKVKLKKGTILYSTESEGINIGFVLYNNDQFFRSQVFQPSLNIKRKVIAGYPAKENVLDFVEFTVRDQNVPSMHLYDFTCVFWDYDKNDWNTKGCKKVCSFAHKMCRCNGTMNLANFAMLMSFSLNPENIQALNVISLLGCALSVVGLTITVIFQILTRKLRRSSTTLLMVSICVCMTIVYLLFIFDIKNTTPSSSSFHPEENIVPLSEFHQDPNFPTTDFSFTYYGPCTAFTILLHYFLLAAFTWSTLYATHIFLLIKNTLLGLPQYFSVLSISVGWGLPAAVVGISLGIAYRINNPLNYRQQMLCWLAALDQNNRFDGRKPMLWGFLLPVAVMLLFNIAILFYFSYTTCRTNPDLNSSEAVPLRSKMFCCVSMAVVLGLSWVFGSFMLLEKEETMKTIFSFAFCLRNTTQGLQIFVLFTLRAPIFKKKALALLKIIRAPISAIHRKTFDLQTDHEESDFDLYELSH